MRKNTIFAGIKAQTSAKKIVFFTMPGNDEKKNAGKIDHF